MTDEAQLVEAARRGEDVAFRAIVDRYRDGVLAIALTKLRDPRDAEDVAQLTFVEAYQRLGELQDCTRLGAWLRSIAHNRAIDMARGNLRRGAHAGSMELAPPSPATPQEEMERREVRDQVWEAVHRLKRPQREALILHYLSGFSHDEIARMLRVPVGTVKSRLSKARAHVKKVTLSQVEHAMKRQALQSGFSDRVFQLLSLYPERGRMYDPAVGEPLKQVDPASCREGFLRALTVPHWRTRRAAVHYMRLKAPGRLMEPDEILEVARVGLKDRNRAVRMGSAMVLHDSEVWGERWETEVLPLLFALLFDESRKVRRRVARFVAQFGQLVPLDTAVRAMAQEVATENLPVMQRLLQASLVGQEVRE